MNLSTVKWAQWDKNQSRELLVCSYVCAVHCVQLSQTILHRTDLIIFPLALQTITIALMMSIWGKWGYCVCSVSSFLLWLHCDINLNRYTYYITPCLEKKALPSVLWRCWLVGRKGIQPVKEWGMVKVGKWLVRMEWRPAGWSAFLLLKTVFPLNGCLSSVISIISWIIDAVKWTRLCKPFVLHVMKVKQIQF